MRGDSVAPDAAGAWLATAAQLEAASVPAFEILARELKEHGAPRQLVSLAIQAAEDERIHARLVGALGRQLGARPGPVAVRSNETRNLFAIALENAVEGLVREAYGARIGFEQANTAGLAQIRVAYRDIARDEARHATLAALVHGWIMPRLHPLQQRLVVEARERALHELVEQCSQEPPEALRHLLGLPEATRAVELAVLERA
jgi:rubrerythrin